MKKIYMIAAAMCLSATAANAEGESRAFVWEAPEFVESEWTNVGLGEIAPGIWDWSESDYPYELDALVYVNKANPTDLWIQPDTEGINVEGEDAYMVPSAFILHVADPQKVYTDPIYWLHPMIFCLCQRVPYFLGMQGSDEYYGKLEGDKVSFPAYCYALMNMPTGEAVSNKAGNFAITLPAGALGIEGIEADNGVAEYYNLQGLKVVNPENGVFIKKTGNKAVKVRR